MNNTLQTSITRPVPVAASRESAVTRAPGVIRRSSFVIRHWSLVTAAALLASAVGLRSACVEIKCPDDIVIGCQNADGAVVNFAPDASTTCSTPIEVACQPPSGSLFSIGTNSVQCVVHDPRGNTARCDFLVIVTNEPPTIQCPSNIVAECQSPLGATVNFTATGSGGCGAPVNITCTPPSGSVFPIGTNGVQCVATDNQGRTARCAFLVIVTNGLPEITCPPPITLTANATCRGVVPLIPITVKERCTPSNQLVVAQSPPVGTLLALGDHTVTVYVTEPPHNVASCTVTVHVVDGTPPKVNCPGSVKAYCSPDGTNVFFNADATDNCDGPVAVTCQPSSGSFFAAGSTTVTCTATDAAGNSGQCTFSVNVMATPPTLHFVAGSKDNYLLPSDPPSKSACLATIGGSMISHFDFNFPGRPLGHSFENLPGGIEWASIRFHMKPKGSVSSNDVVRIGLTNCLGSWAWSALISSLPGAGGVWTTNQDGNFSLNLAAMPGSPSDLLSLLGLDTTHRLDVVVAEDTVVDWIELSIMTCQTSGAVGGVPYMLKQGEALPGPDDSIEFSSDDERLPFDVDLNIGKADGIEIEVGEWPGNTNPPISECISPVGSYELLEYDWKPDNQVLCNVKFWPNNLSEYVDVSLTQPTNVSTSGRAIEIWAKGEMVTRYFVKDPSSGVVLRDEACLLSMGFGIGEFFMALSEPSDVWIVSGDHISGETQEPFQGDFIRMFFNVPFTVGGPVVRHDPDLVLNVKGRDLDVRKLKLRKLGGRFETTGPYIFSIGDDVMVRPNGGGERSKTCFEPALSEGQWNRTEAVAISLADVFGTDPLVPGAAFDIEATGVVGTTPPHTTEIGRLRCEIVSVNPLVTRFRANYSNQGLTTTLTLYAGDFNEFGWPTDEFLLQGAPTSISFFVADNYANFIVYFDPAGGLVSLDGGQLFSKYKFAWFTPVQPPLGIHQSPYKFCVTRLQAWENMPITFFKIAPPPPPPAPSPQCVTMQCPRTVVRWSADGIGAVVDYDVEARSACGSNVTVTCVPPSGSMFPVGVTFVTCHAVDELGYQDRCRFPVVVYPAEPRLRIEPRGEGQIAMLLPAEFRPAEFVPAEFLPAEFFPAEFRPAEFLPAEFKGWMLEAATELPGHWEDLGPASETTNAWLLPAIKEAWFFRLRAR